MIVYFYIKENLNGININLFLKINNFFFIKRILLGVFIFKIVIFFMKIYLFDLFLIE